MESDWETFTKALNEKIESKIAPLENQLNFQQELIGKLSLNLEKIIESINSKSHNKLDLAALKKDSSLTGTEKSSNTTNPEENEEKPAEVITNE